MIPNDEQTSLQIMLSVFREGYEEIIAEYESDKYPGARYETAFWRLRGLCIYAIKSLEGKTK